MELIEDGCSVPANWADAMTLGLTSMNVDEARIVATANFARTVAELTGNAAYTTERGGGAVAARTVTGPEGSVVVLNYNELSSLSSTDIQRILAHEAGHILIDARRTEETSGNRDSDETDWQWWLKCLGAQAIIELRIERSLTNLGYPAADSTTATAVDHSLLVTNIEVVNAVIDPVSNDPANLQNALLTTLNHVTKLLAYIAAPLTAGQTGFSPSQLSVDGQANWADYIAPTWEQRIAFWSSVPPAVEPITVKEWRKILRESVTHEKALLRSFGFAFEDMPGGEYGFFRKSSDDVFTERLRRAQTQTGLQPD
jgi:hypothetical protein